MKNPKVNDCSNCLIEITEFDWDAFWSYAGCSIIGWLLYVPVAIFFSILIIVCSVIPVLNTYLMDCLLERKWISMHKTRMIPVQKITSEPIVKAARNINFR